MASLLRPIRNQASAVVHGPWASVLVVWLFCFSALRETDRLGFWKDQRTLNWDIEAYYHYLPAAIIHRDLGDLSYVAAVDSMLHPGLEQNRYGILTDPHTGRDYIKYTYGTALFELPLFLLAHAYERITGTVEPAGYSPHYQLSVSLSTVLFVTWGLFILRAFLRRHVPDRDTAIALFILAMGTNLFFYSTHDSGMSHGYLFFLFALVLDRTDRWHRSPNWTDAALLGLVIGLVTVIRPVDGLVALIPLFWAHRSSDRWTSTWTQLIDQPLHAVVAALCFTLPLLPQLFYWKAVTGHFLFYSYGDEGFDFGHPHIMDGLLSFRKGWLVYSPLIVLGFLGLLFLLMDHNRRRMAVPLLVYFPITFFVVFSWHQWWYGGSFGCRPLVPSLALLALPMAVFSGVIFQLGRILGLTFLVVVLGGTWLNHFQQDQYHQTIIHWDSMTGERYWQVFGARNWDGLEPFP